MNDHFLMNAYSVAKIDGKYFYWVSTLGVLFCFDPITNENVIVYKEMDVSEKYSVCVAWEDCLFLVPFRSSKLCIYNYHDGRCKYVKLEEMGMFCRAYVIDDNVILWRWGKGGVAKFDARTQKVTQVKSMMKVNVASNGWQIDDRIYGYDSDAGKLFCFVADEDKVNYIDSPTFDMKVSTVLLTGQEIWISGDKNKIYRLSTNGKIYKEYGLDVVTVKEDFWSNDLFMDSYVIGNKIYFSPYKANELVSIDLTTDEVFKEREICNTEVGGAFICLIDYIIWNVIPINGQLARNQYIIKDNCVKEKDILFVSEGYEFISRDEVAFESKFKSLKDFVKAIDDLDTNSIDD